LPGGAAGQYTWVEEQEAAMPLHDWTRIETYVYHHFHSFWLGAICRVLNRGQVLPAGFYAMAEQVTRTMGPDVLTLQTSPNPLLPPAGGVVPGNPLAVRVAVSESPPRAKVVGTAPPRKPGFRQRRVAIRHSSDDRLVALIELVSPGNKSATSPFRSFVGKAVRAIEAGIHLLVIDPFPPGKRDPNGVHGAIWEELGGDPYRQPNDKPLTVASYEANPEGPRCYVEPLAAGDVLPDAALFLEPGYYVPVPLERSYRDAFEDVLPQHRALLEP
jgi:hypothetical protein